MKALITGATGFIGSHLAELLHARGYELRAMVRPSSDTKYINHLPVELVQGNFDDVESLRKAIEGVDYIYHVAGVVAAKNQEAFFRGNQAATANLLKATESHPIKRFIHVSSQAAVGPATREDEPVDEKTPFHPITTYGRSKAAAEKEVLERMNNIPATIVRPPAVYGPRDIGVYSFFQVAARGFAPLIGFGRKVVSLVHVRDLVRGFVQAGESSAAEGETYFISSENFYTWEEVGDVTARVFGRKKARYLRVPHAVIYAAAGMSGFAGRFQTKPPILDFEKGRDITRAFWICKVDKARTELGYHQEVGLEEGVSETIEWYRRNGML